MKAGEDYISRRFITYTLRRI